MTPAVTPGVPILVTMRPAVYAGYIFFGNVDGLSSVTEWAGTAVTGTDSGKTVETGPQILIRHPAWTAERPRQDIPIMVFTIS